MTQRVIIKQYLQKIFSKKTFRYQFIKNNPKEKYLYTFVFSKHVAYSMMLQTYIYLPILK